MGGRPVTLITGASAGIGWALAEMEDMAHAALRYYSELHDTDMRWILVEATERILTEVGLRMGQYTVEALRRRGMEVLLNTRLESCVDGNVRLSDGQSFAADTIVWTAGVKASPMLERTDFPRDSKGRITCLPTLQVANPDGGTVAAAWSAPGSFEVRSGEMRSQVWP